MKRKILLCLALGLSGVLLGCSTAKNSFESTDRVNNNADNNLTKHISNILAECQKIKPGMARAELLNVFRTEGGISTAKHRTYVYRGCPYIKVDVDFTRSDPKQYIVEERPSDTVSKISKPFGVEYW